MGALLYIFAYITMGTSYLSPRVYAIMHRSITHSPIHLRIPIHQSIFQMYLPWWPYQESISVHSAWNQRRWRFTKTFLNGRLWTDWATHGIRVQDGDWRILGFICSHHRYGGSAAAGAVVHEPGTWSDHQWYAHKYGYTNHKLNNTLRIYCL